VTEPRYSALGGHSERWPPKPGEFYLTCDETPVVKISYPVFDHEEAESAMSDDTFLEYANTYLDVEVIRPGQGWVEVIPDGVGRNGRTLEGRVRRNRYGRLNDDLRGEVVRYRAVIRCPGCGEPIAYRVEKLLRAMWLKHPHLHPVSHRLLPAILGSPDQA
jgi:hypothetical protein